jgi:GTP cyclohydrolase II
MSSSTKRKPGLIVRCVVRARIPTDNGEFELCAYENNWDDKEHLALIKGAVVGKSNVLTRIHSECYTGDVLGSRRCDCGPQLNEAMRRIEAEGEGVVIYLRQEGRGIGLVKKLQAYNLQDQGYDTVDANLALGHSADERDYTIAAAILRDLKINSVRLMTNNPHKIDSLTSLGIEIHERVELQTAIHADNERYLTVKAQRMNHLLRVEE